MTIAVGDHLPQAEFLTMTADGTQKLSTDTIFAGRKVVLFAVPGAFTPTCSMNHLPGFVGSRCHQGEGRRYGRLRGGE